MTKEVKKAVIPVMGTGKGLFPFTKHVPRELLPLGDLPLIQHIVNEAIDSGIEEIIFVLSSFNKPIVEQFKNLDKLTKKEEGFKKYYSSVSFSHILQKKKSENGYTISRAEKDIGVDSFALSFPDFVFHGKSPALKQLYNIFRTSGKTVVALTEIDDENVSDSFVAETEKIANRFYKIKKIRKKPKPEKIKSRLAVTGRYILTPLVFEALKEVGENGTLVDALNKLITDGKVVYGYQTEGRWFCCKDKLSYLKANSFFMHEDSVFSNDLKNYTKQII